MYETVFTISWPGPQFPEFFIWFIGMVCLCLVYPHLIRNRKGLFIKMSPKASHRFNMVFFSLLLLIITGLFCAYLISSYKLVGQYKKGCYEIVEGQVLVLHKQPEGGHDVGDKVLIDGTKLIIDYFDTTNAYNQTIAHGGVLKDGVHAKVYHHDGKILRIDILKTENGKGIPADSN